MSVSSHLSPEPERRLWIIHEHVRAGIQWTDARLAALGALAVLELAFLPAASLLVRVVLAAALPVCVLALSPAAGRLHWLDGRHEKPDRDDSLVAPEDLVKYTQAELVLRLDKYLGGGITATHYYEDLVAQILALARTSRRKTRLFGLTALLVAAGQLGVLATLALRR